MFFFNIALPAFCILFVPYSFWEQSGNRNNISYVTYVCLATTVPGTNLFTFEMFSDYILI